MRSNLKCTGLPVLVLLSLTLAHLGDARPHNHGHRLLNSLRHMVHAAKVNACGPALASQAAPGCGETGICYTQMVSH